MLHRAPRYASHKLLYFTKAFAFFFISLTDTPAESVQDTNLESSLPPPPLTLAVRTPLVAEQEGALTKDSVSPTVQESTSPLGFSLPTYSRLLLDHKQIGEEKEKGGQIDGSVTSTLALNAHLPVTVNLLDIIFQYLTCSSVQDFKMEGQEMGDDVVAQAEQSLAKMSLDLTALEDLFKHYPEFKESVGKYIKSNPVQALLFGGMAPGVKIVKILLTEMDLSLTYLDLTHSQFKLPMLKHLVTSPHLLQLQTLRISGNNLGTAGVTLLTQSHWPDLRRLDLSRNGLGNRGVYALMQGKWPNLTMLALNNNRIDDCGMQVLSWSPWPLQYLDVSRNWASGLGIALLRAGKPTLQQIVFVGNKENPYQKLLFYCPLSPPATKGGSPQKAPTSLSLSVPYLSTPLDAEKTTEPPAPPTAAASHAQRSPSRSPETRKKRRKNPERRSLAEGASQPKTV